MSRSHATFPVLNAVRGFAFLLVLFSHVGNYCDWPTRGLGQFGVWIFFLLSSFLLSRPFFAQPAALREAGAWRDYFVRRALRIFPPLLFALLAFHFALEWDWRAVWLNFLCVRGTGIFWTVFTETRFYLLLPLVVLAILGLEKRPVLGVTLVVVGLAVHLHFAPFWQEMKLWRGWGDYGVTERTFVNYLPVFVAGTLMAWAHVRIAASPAATVRWQAAAPYGFYAALGVIVMLSPGALSGILRTRVATGYYHGWWTPMLPITGSLVFFATYLAGWPARLWGNPGLQFIGKISYSGYLFHFLVLHHFMYLKSAPVFVLCVVVTSLVIATIGHYLLERPFITLGNRLRPAPAA